jgi:hypothetical protein
MKTSCMGSCGTWRVSAQDHLHTSVDMRAPSESTAPAPIEARYVSTIIQVDSD